VGKRFLFVFHFYNAKFRQEDGQKIFPNWVKQGSSTGMRLRTTDRTKETLFILSGAVQKILAQSSWYLKSAIWGEGVVWCTLTLTKNPCTFHIGKTEHKMYYFCCQQFPNDGPAAGWHPWCMENLRSKEKSWVIAPREDLDAIVRWQLPSQRKSRVWQFYCRGKIKLKTPL